MTKVLIADDHHIVRDAIKMRLLENDDIEVVGEAANGLEAIDLAKAEKPEVVIMDVEMPAIDGIQATKQIIEQSPGTKVIIFTAHPQPDLLALALRAGATGYVLKSSSAAELHEAVHTVAGGGTFVNGGFDAPSPGVSNLEALSPREVEILQLLAEGKRAKDIANELSLSPATVHTHVRNAISKLEVDTRTQAVALAVRFRYLVDAPELEELDESTNVGGNGAGVLPSN